MGSSFNSETRIANEPIPIVDLNVSIISHFNRICNITTLIPADLINLIACYTARHYECYEIKLRRYDRYAIQLNDHFKSIKAYHKINISKLIHNGYKTITADFDTFIQRLDHSIWKISNNITTQSDSKLIDFSMELESADYIRLISTRKYNGNYAVQSNEIPTIFITNSGKLYQKYTSICELCIDRKKLMKSISKVQCGYKHCLFLSCIGKVYVIGTNKYGACGLGENESIEINDLQPLKVLSKIFMIDITVCNYSNLCLSNNGNVYGFGQNNYWQLAMDSVNNCNHCVYIPQVLEWFLYRGINVIQMDMNNDYSAFVSDKNQLYTIGNNEYGVIGNGNYLKIDDKLENLIVKRPFLIRKYKVKFVCCSYRLLFFITNDRELYGIGIYLKGETSLIPILVARNSVQSRDCLVLKEKAYLKSIIACGKHTLFIASVPS
eukprot:177149_1